MLNGYDIDGVLLPNKSGSPGGVIPLLPCVIISGRLFAEYTEPCKLLSQHYPVYIRGVGKPHDKQHSGRFKALMINLLGVTTFHEDDPLQIEIIKRLCPKVKVIKH